MTQSVHYNGRFPTDPITLAIAVLGSVYVLHDMTAEQAAALATTLGLVLQILQLVSETRRR